MFYKNLHQEINSSNVNKTELEREYERIKFKLKELQQNSELQIGQL